MDGPCLSMPTRGTIYSSSKQNNKKPEISSLYEEEVMVFIQETFDEILDSMSEKDNTAKL